LKKLLFFIVFCAFGYGGYWSFEVSKIMEQNLPVGISKTSIQDMDPILARTELAKLSVVVKRRPVDSHTAKKDGPSRNDLSLYSEEVQEDIREDRLELQRYADEPVSFEQEDVDDATVVQAQEEQVARSPASDKSRALSQEEELEGDYLDQEAKEEILRHMNDGGSDEQ